MSEQKKVAPTPVGSKWRRRGMFALAWLAVAGACYGWGRYTSLPRAAADAPVGQAVAQSSATSNLPPSDNSRRAVAYIHGNIAITREELGEYLIARFAADRMNNLINLRIIEQAAKQRGIEVSAAEINAGLSADAAALGVSPKLFSEQILKRYGKTLYEWKEDVIRPRLMMEKMCRARVAVENEDLVKAFEAYHGEKVDCKLVMWPKTEKDLVLRKIWPLIRNDEKEFDHYARIQASPSLASVGGHVKPLGRHTTGDDRLEKVLFSLRPGEVSEVIDTNEGLVVIKCLGRVAPDTTVTFEQRRAVLEKEVIEKKVALEINKLFRELHSQAKPQNLIQPSNNVISSVEKELKLDIPGAGATTNATAPASNAAGAAIPTPPAPPVFTPPGGN